MNTLQNGRESGRKSRSREGSSSGTEGKMKVEEAEWGEWAWSLEHEYWYRSKLNDAGNGLVYDYDYEWPPPDTKNEEMLSQTQSVLQDKEYPLDSQTNLPFYSTALKKSMDLDVACTWPSCSRKFTNVRERDRHYTTVHANSGARQYKCEVAECVADVTSWTTAGKLRLHNKNWHGAYHCKFEGCKRDFPNGFASQVDLDAHQDQVHHKLKADVPSSYFTTPTDSSLQLAYSHQAVDLEEMVSGMAINVPMKDQTIYSNESSEPLPKQKRWVISNDSSKVYVLDRQYKVHKSKDFEVGRLFKVLWSEPTGKGKYGTDISEDEAHTPSKYGMTAHHKIRRFLIVRNKTGHCLCLPILTYGGQGLLKRGTHNEDHAAIFSGGKPVFREGERPGYSSLKVDVIDPSHHLHPMARINFAKVYTVEHNVKVAFIGKVNKKYLQRLLTSYDEANKPLSIIHSSYVPIGEDDESDDLSSKGIDYNGGYNDDKRSESLGDRFDDGLNFATSPPVFTPMYSMGPRMDWGEEQSSYNPQPTIPSIPSIYYPEQAQVQDEKGDIDDIYGR